MIGGCEDPEFEVHSLALMAYFVSGAYRLVASALTIQELAAAPEKVRGHRARVPDGHVEVLELDAEALELADEYNLDRSSR